MQQLFQLVFGQTKSANRCNERSALIGFIYTLHIGYTVYKRKKLISNFSDLAITEVAY